MSVYQQVLQRASVRTQAVFDYIVEYKSAHDGIAPSLDDIMQAVGISSKSVAMHHLHKLERNGRIRRPEYGANRHIEVVGGRWELITPPSSSVVPVSVVPDETPLTPGG